jgi:hypothetical protein
MVTGSRTSCLRTQYQSKPDKVSMTRVQAPEERAAKRRARLRDGVAEMLFFLPPENGLPIMLSANLHNAVSVLLIPPQEECRNC